jgi:hypothetical protein
LQAQPTNENEFIPQLPITVNPSTEARLAAEFYLELIKQKVPTDIAKDLTIAYILKQHPFGQ